MIVGETVPNVITAGPGNVTLIGGPGDDILTGGSGTDIIDGGGGTGFEETSGDTLIAGSGPDTFIYDHGYDFTTIENFKLGVDHIVVNGASSYTAYWQGIDYGGVLIDFGGNDEIFLPGLQVSQITPSMFTFNPGPQLASAPSTPTPSGTPTSGITLTNGTTYQVAQGQTLNFQDEAAFTLQPRTSLSVAAPSIVNAGTVFVVGDGVTDYSSNYYLGAGPATVFTNTATGRFYVVAGAAGDVDGYDDGGLYGASQGANIDNAGFFQVTAAGFAQGFLDTASQGIPLTVTNESTGVLDVWGGSEAVGVDVWGTLNNAGEIEVTGGIARAVEDTVDLDNSGTIIATGADNPWVGQPSIGVYIDGGVARTFVNSGLIQGDYAIEVNPDNYTPPVNLDNSGQLIGKLSLGYHGNQITNTGSIQGAIYLGDGANIYDGEGGTQTGGIYGGTGSNQVTLGDDGEVYFGEGGNDSITGGAGNDVIVVSRGDDTIDGGGGFNILSFATSDVGVTANLATGVATVNNSTDSIKNIQEIIGSNFADTLTAAASGSVLIGGAGHDTLIGGAGSDTLVSGIGGAMMTGGGGNNAFVYSAGDGSVAIIDFAANGDQDKLEIYGYSGYSLQQSGADTLVVLSPTDTVRLDGIQASSVTSSEIVLESGQYSTPTLPPPPPAPDATNLVLYQDYLNPTGRTLNLIGYANAIMDLGDPSGDTLASFTNSGDINIATRDTVAGFDCPQGLKGTSVFDNTAGATFSVDNDSTVSTTGSAVGFVGYSWSPDFVNAGLFSVQTSYGDGYGVKNWDPDFVFTNTGNFQVTAPGGAYGLSLVNAGLIHNTGGTITATGGAYATAIYMGNTGNTPDGQNPSVDNTGTITATTTQAGATSYGIVVDGTDIGQVNITNSGVITADVAIDVADGGYSPQSFPDLILNNSNTINGDIICGQTYNYQYFKPTTDKIVNSGVINGNVYIGNASTTFDSSTGTVNGVIDIGAHAVSTDTIQDTIDAGAGDNLIHIESGEPGAKDTIDGGGGINTIEYDVASSAVTLARNSNGTLTITGAAIGADTVSHIQSLKFTDRSIDISTLPHDHNDFMGDGQSQFLIENTFGQVVVGEAQSNGQTSYTQVSWIGTQWRFEETGDFLGNGQDQFLIENANGAVVVGDVQNGQEAFTQVAGIGSEWAFVGAGDYLGDGRSQFMIENTLGQMVLGEVGPNNQTTFTQVSWIGTQWRFEETGDFLGNGQDQVLIENANGAVVVGNVKNGQEVYTQVAGIGSEWKFVGSGDYLGDGKSQFLIENTVGQVVVGEVAADGQTTFTQVAWIGSEWKFVGAGDYSRTGQDSFLIENQAGALVTGTVVNGSARFTQISGVGAEWSFQG